MKKVLVIISMILILGVTTACGATRTEDGKKLVKIHEHCTRTGTMQGNAQASLTYEIYYTGDILNKIESHEKVISSSKEILDMYEESYKGIHKHYEGIKYYDTDVIRTDASVESVMIINYDRVDVSKIIALEGEEGNIFENKIPKVSKWKELTKKVGMQCEAAS